MKMVSPRNYLLSAITALLFLHISPERGAQAQNLVVIDATADAAKPVPVAAKLGASRNPNGEEIGANSQYLTLGGKPWLPVMGEFHFSRYSEAEWEPEILKMKAAGVQIISTYVIWIHHEQTEDVFDWSGQRDLRRFVRLCGKHGMYVYPRIGPWAHAETRNGGLPDWVLKNSPVRQNDPVYLKEVQSFYQEVAKQLQGQLWKDGGPVIGIQIENEYRDKGAGKGDEHIRTLKNMAIADGLDVPLYTVTGWDGAAIPLDQVLPVFGGYPDAPWDGSPDKLPPNEVYAFRFNNRAAGSMGAIGGSGQNAASSYRGTPFLTAEIGGGIEDTYFRRPVVSADDVAAIAPVMLGSGANLLGYYMFHGGRNPDGVAITLQESQSTGYPTDVPVKSYDFQAPLGEYGQMRESLRKLKLIHYFLNDFGSILAPTVPRVPDKVPSSPADVSIPRVSARTLGDAGFIFLNNYVRGLTMPARPGFQVEMKLPSGTVRIPEQPISLPSGAYGIWPVNLELPGTTLRYSTAQLFKRVQAGKQTDYFFFAIPGVAPEFALDARAKAMSCSGALIKTSDSHGLRLQLNPEVSAVIRLAGEVNLVLVPESAAENVWRTDDPSLLLSTRADFFSDKGAWTLQSDGKSEIDFGVFGTDAQPSSERMPIQQLGTDGIFRNYKASLPDLDLHPKVIQVRAAATRPPWKFGPPLDWRPTPTPIAPDDADFEGASVWRLTLPPIPETAAVSDVLLKISYQGDVARLYRRHQVVDDSFWNSIPWTIGLREIGPGWRTASSDLELRILPLPRKHSMYLEEADKLVFSPNGVADSITGVQMVPRYQLNLRAPALH
jgi:beta-galactosidase